MAASKGGSNSEVLKAIKGLDTRLKSIDGHLGKVDARLGRIEGRLNDIEAYVPSNGKVPASISSKKSGARRARR